MQGSSLGAAIFQSNSLPLGWVLGCQTLPNLYLLLLLKGQSATRCPCVREMLPALQLMESSAVAEHPQGRRVLGMDTALLEFFCHLLSSAREDGGERCSSGYTIFLDSGSICDHLESCSALEPPVLICTAPALCYWMCVDSPGPAIDRTALQGLQAVKVEPPIHGVLKHCLPTHAFAKHHAAGDALAPDHEHLQLLHHAGTAVRF